MNASFTETYPLKQFLDETGRLVSQLSAAVSTERIVQFYETLVLIREFDKKAVALQRTGQMGTYASCLGQEAISAGIGFAMRSDDVLAPYYRDQAAQYLRGVSLCQLLQYWGGDERANHFSGVARQDLPNCVPIATQLTHAAGIASAFKIRGQKRAVVTTCGEGASSRGDFYESLNLAGVWQLPMVIVVNNNQWAISTPRALQSVTETIAQKACAAGIAACRVDGNDICAVFDVVSEALQRAHQGKGATLIEALSYRLCDHTTADDATRYRSAEELNEAWQREPIKRLQTHLFSQGLWSPAQEQELQQRCRARIDSAVNDYLSLQPQAPADLFDYLYEELPFAYEGQRQHLIEAAQKNRGGLGHGC